MISQYGKLVSEQLKNERVSIIGTGNPDVQRQIEQLSNLVALENMNNMNNCGTGLPISATRQ